MISPQLERIILEQLDLDSVDIGPETAATDVPGWDSLAHVRIIVAVERGFGVRFSAMEVMQLRTVCDLQALIDRKTAVL